MASDAKNKTSCENCNKIKECIECSGTLINPICLKCKEGFNLENNKCLEELCIIGDEDKCKTCKNETGRKKECNSCNEGYYLEENTISYKCLKCSVENCKKCSKSFGYEICDECNNNFLLIKDDNDITYSCICPAYYELTEEKICKKTGNWVEAEYYVYKINDFYYLKILRLLNNGLKSNEIEVYMNNTKIQFSFFDNYIYYNFTKVGRYKLKINFNTILYDMSSLFEVFPLVGIKFLPGFDSSKVTDMRDLFFGSYLEYLDLKYLQTNKVEYIDHFIYDCSKLISLDMSKFNTSNLQSMRGMFFNNWNIKEIDFSSFDTSNVNRCENLFDNYPRNITIKISNNFKNCKEFIPLELKVINVDDLLCKQFENCKGCIGSKETLSCNICEFGYELHENRCIVPNCTIGENEKCKRCNYQTENECLLCNEGYYLPDNSINKKICNKCKVDGCDICDNITGNCQKCQLNYKPILDEITSKIVACKIVCEIGKENKCSSCNLEEENKCLSCNPGYKLMKDGSCKKIENSFIAIYNVTLISDHVKLFKKEIGNWEEFYLIDFADIEAYINQNKINLELCFYNHHFCYKPQKTGLIEIKVIIKKTLSNLRDFFGDCDQLIQVEFSETFDTSHVLSLDSMFMRCTSLKSANLSSFNTSLVSRMVFMFYYCFELTSVDLSNFDTRNVISFQDMFQNNYKLNWIDISSFNTSKSESNPSSIRLFKGVYDKGTIIINKNIYNGNIPDGWNITYKNE